MAKLTQAAVKEKLEAWAAAELEIGKVEAARAKALDPIINRHNIEILDASAKFIKKLNSLTDSSLELFGEIEEWLESQPKAVRIETARAMAELRVETLTKTGPRVVDAQAFIAKANSQKKDPWTCIKVEVGKAEKLLGPKDIDTVSKRTETTTEQRIAAIELK